MIVEPADVGAKLEWPFLVELKIANPSTEVDFVEPMPSSPIVMSSLSPAINLIATIFSPA